MNIITLNKQTSPVTRNLFARMEYSLKSTGASFEKSVRLARILAPIVQDQSSNSKHLATLESETSSLEDKVMAIIMLGFPKNQQILPILHKILLTGTDSLKIAAAMSIIQIRTGKNSETLKEVLIDGFMATKSPKVQHSIRQSLLTLLDKKTANLVKILLPDYSSTSSTSPSGKLSSPASAA